MSEFIVNFFISNIFVSAIIVILIVMKRIFKNHLTNRMQYNLWFILLVLLAVPFLPISYFRFDMLFSWIEKLKTGVVSDTAMTINNSVIHSTDTNSGLMEDFALSVSKNTSSYLSLLLYAIWITGILVMTVFLIKSKLYLNKIKKSSLILQNKDVTKLYKECLQEMGIKRNIPVYSTAFLKSPVITGLFQPKIYLPIHLISDYNATDMRYMLLHELQHYKHKDLFANYIINITSVLYWFNPLVWYALGIMKNDREIACDTSVLNILKESEYETYGNTLINFASKISFLSIPFASGIGGNMKQIKQRIINIASYKKPTTLKKSKSIMSFIVIATMILSFAPTLSAGAKDNNHYNWKISDKNINYMDFSEYFEEYDGCFVLYNVKNNIWDIYNIKNATLRKSPDSTYKIYNALFGLEEGIITPEYSYMKWNGEIHPYDMWNKDQTLSSAMSSSVNWYFQSLDNQIGTSVLNSYINKIGYGNKNISGDLSSYWLESSLKISPVEQIQLLTKLYYNEFGFKSENINAVKSAICISSSDNGSIYGKTGTGQINEKNVNGWFIGYVETFDKTYFFATNIQAKDEATGSKAAEITKSILSDMNIWQ